MKLSISKYCYMTVADKKITLFGTNIRFACRSRYGCDENWRICWMCWYRRKANCRGQFKVFVARFWRIYNYIIFPRITTRCRSCFMLTASPADCWTCFCFVVLLTAGADTLLIFEGDLVLIWATWLFDPVAVGNVPVEIDDLSSAPLVALKIDEPLLFRDVSGEGFLGYLSAIISTEVVESWLYKFGFWKGCVWSRSSSGASVKSCCSWNL